MGANLYRESLAEDEGGYFRDSYNKSNLLHQLDLDWWGVVNSLTKDNYISVENMIILLAKVKEKDIPEQEEKWYMI